MRINEKEPIRALFSYQLGFPVLQKITQNHLQNEDILQDAGKKKR